MILAFSLYGSPPIKQLADLMQWLLSLIHKTGLTWGWSIIVLTLLVRLALVPLTVKQQQSMRQMQALQPEIKQIQEKHKGDRAEQQAALMEFYKEKGVNPFGSCLPLLAQIPIFIALYAALRGEKHFQDDTPLNFLGSVIPDITAHLQSLPTATVVGIMVLYVGSQLLSTLLVPSTADPTQKYIFLAMPLVFAVFIFNGNFPIGLMMYWITSNLWTVGQGWVIRKYYPPPAVLQQQAQKEAEEAYQLAREAVVGVERGKHADVVAFVEELLGERLDVPRDAARIGPGIRRNQGYAHPRGHDPHPPAGLGGVGPSAERRPRSFVLC